MTARIVEGLKPQQVYMKLGGDIDGALEGKNAWDDAVRTFVPRMLDNNIVN